MTSLYLQLRALPSPDVVYTDSIWTSYGESDCNLSNEGTNVWTCTGRHVGTMDIFGCDFLKDGLCSLFTMDNRLRTVFRVMFDSGHDKFGRSVGEFWRRYLFMLDFVSMLTVVSCVVGWTGVVKSIKNIILVNSSLCVCESLCLGNRLISR